MSKRLSLVILVILHIFHCKAQCTLQVQLQNEDNKALKYAEVGVSQHDSLVAFAKINGNKTSFVLPSYGKYSLDIYSPGYEDNAREIFLSGDTLVSVLLRQTPIELSEVTIKANIKSRLTATGEIFKLTQKARQSGNPFVALAEIPLLEVDIMNQTIKTNDGSTPLILVDGKMLNTGIAPIDPKFIDEVHVEEVPSVRYLHMGYNKIINIKLKRESPWYSYTDIRTRHDIPLREGFGGANFEFGSKKIAISGSLFGQYMHNDENEIASQETSNSHTKLQSGENIKKYNQYEGSLLLKWLPSSCDYLSFVVKNSKKHQKERMTLDGQYAGDIDVTINSKDMKKTDDGGFLTGVFHEHTFVNKSVLTSFFKYNRGIYDLADTYDEMVDASEYSENIFLSTRRNLYTLTVDYEGRRTKNAGFLVGVNAEYTNDNIKYENKGVTSNAKIDRMNNFIYASYQYNWNRIFIMASAGLQHLNVKVTDADNAYMRPKASFSASWKVDAKQSLKLSYSLTNELPRGNQLIAFNTSTNPWLRNEGNPYLTPMKIQQIGMNYDISLGSARAQLFATQTYNSDMIESWLYEMDDVTIQSYRNNGNFRLTATGGRFMYRKGHFQTSVSAAYNWETYNHQDVKTSVSANGYVRWNFNKFFIYTTLSWKSKDYTPIGYTRYNKPIEAHAQIAWNISKQLYVSVGMPYYWGVKKVTSVVGNDNYNRIVHTRYKSASLRPWILFSWTIRKNQKNSIRNKMPKI